MPAGLLRRSRLIERLSQDLDHQLILVCPPAGFGKTTLIGTWLERMAAAKACALYAGRGEAPGLVGGGARSARRRIAGCVSPSDGGTRPGGR
jgi:hypothetical protein